MDFLISQEYIFANLKAPYLNNTYVCKSTFTL